MRTTTIQDHFIPGIIAFAVLVAMPLVSAPNLFAQNLSPAGNWKTISDKTG